MLSAISPLTNGVGIFSVTFLTVGKQTLTATDIGNAAVTSSAVVTVVNLSPIDPFVESIDRTNAGRGPVTTASTLSFTVIFSEAVTGVVASDFLLVLAGTAAGTVSQGTPVSGSIYTVDRQRHLGQWHTGTEPGG